MVAAVYFGNAASDQHQAASKAPPTLNDFIEALLSFYYLFKYACLESYIEN